MFFCSIIFFFLRKAFISLSLGFSSTDIQEYLLFLLSVLYCHSKNLPAAAGGNWNPSSTGSKTARKQKKTPLSL